MTAIEPPHPVKHETFDPGAMTNTDPKGYVRPVDEFRREPWGLYMARPADHPSFFFLESWMLPQMGLRVSVFHFTAGHETDQDFYVDIGEFTDHGTHWTSQDHYVDLVVRTGRGTQLLDVDELFDAVHAGLLAPPAAERAVMRAAYAIDGIAAHERDLIEWLTAEGMPIRFGATPRP